MMREFDNLMMEDLGKEDFWIKNLELKIDFWI